MADKLSASRLYQAALAAGFGPGQAATMVEIELAESGGDVDAVGDTSLENATWGPSIGAPQIRTLKGQTGSGSDRDIEALTGDIVAQDKAAYDISQHGADFSPWTSFTSGAYATYSSTLSAIAPSGSSTGSTVPVAGGGAGGPFPVIGPSWLPWNWAADAGNAASGSVTSAASGVLSGARGIVLEIGGALAGVLLIGLGAYRLAAPQIKAEKAKATQAAGVAAKVAML